MSGGFYQWLDLIWLPIALTVAHPGHRLLAAGFVLTCALSLRLQTEIMYEFGYPFGFLGLSGAPVFTRGLVVYGIICALFLILAYFSRLTDKAIFLAAGLSTYIFALCISMTVMAL